MFETKVISDASISSLASSIKSFLNKTQPIQHSISVIFEPEKGSSNKYTAIVSYLEKD